MPGPHMVKPLNPLSNGTSRLIHFHHIFYEHSSGPVCSIVTSPPNHFRGFSADRFLPCQSASQAWRFYQINLAMQAIQNVNILIFHICLLADLTLLYSFGTMKIADAIHTLCSPLYWLWCRCTFSSGTEWRVLDVNSLAAELNMTKLDSPYNVRK